MFNNVLTIEGYAIQGFTAEDCYLARWHDILWNEWMKDGCSLDWRHDMILWLTDILMW